jgi:hypothetical protein
MGLAPGAEERAVTMRQVILEAMSGKDHLGGCGRHTADQSP